MEIVGIMTLLVAIVTLVVVVFLHVLQSSALSKRYKEENRHSTLQEFSKARGIYWSLANTAEKERWDRHQRKAREKERERANEEKRERIRRGEFTLEDLVSFPSDMFSSLPDIGLGTPDEFRKERDSERKKMIREVYEEVSDGNHLLSSDEILNIMEEKLPIWDEDDQEEEADI